MKQYHHWWWISCVPMPGDAFLYILSCQSFQLLFLFFRQKKHHSKHKVHWFYQMWRLLSLMENDSPHKALFLGLLGTIFPARMRIKRMVNRTPFRISSNLSTVFFNFISDQSANLRIQDTSRLQRIVFIFRFAAPIFSVFQMKCQWKISITISKVIWEYEFFLQLLWEIKVLNRHLRKSVTFSPWPGYGSQVAANCKRFNKVKCCLLYLDGNTAPGFGKNSWKAAGWKKTWNFW